jgi:hypothetical protein
MRAVLTADSTVSLSVAVMASQRAGQKGFWKEKQLVERLDAPTAVEMAVEMELMSVVDLDCQMVATWVASWDVSWVDKWVAR